LIGGQLGLRLFIVIEKPSELAMALEEARRLGVDPVFGVRVRLAAEAAGNWQSSGGEKAKFGLNPQQLLQLIEDLKQAGKLHCLRLLHAHLGSQIPTLRDIRKGLRELARYYSELRRLGAPIDNVDVGGGLGVDYEGTGSRHYCSIDYNLRAYASAVTDALKAVCQQEGLPHPNIISESGRAMTAHHAVLITHVSDREEGEAAALAPLQHASPLLASLQENLSLCAAQPLAAFENARAWLAQARSAFDAGQSSLAERAHAESLFKQTCSALRQSLSGDSLHERELLDQINALLATKLFCNFSLFQSMPDIWGIEQIFPIAPLQRLNELPQRRALLHDLTCDSDGCIKRYVDQDGIEASLPVHEAKPGEDYLLGFFLIGAYQEILGDMHNLFGDTDAVNAELCADGGYRLLEPERGDSVDELLRYVHFSPRSMLSAYRRKLQAADLAADTREHYAAELKAGLFGYSYLEE
jgi:arginine decarboxylase